MNKKLKEKLIKHHEEMKVAFPNLYDQQWVEKAADKGWNDLLEDLEKTEPRLAEIAKKKDGYNVFAVIYYCSFENALNTFFKQCMDDTLTTVELSLSELQKITAEIKTKI